jgi:hypothetical protein
LVEQAYCADAGAFAAALANKAMIRSCTCRSALIAPFFFDMRLFLLDTFVRRDRKPNSYYHIRPQGIGVGDDACRNGCRAGKTPPEMLSDALMQSDTQALRAAP